MAQLIWDGFNPKRSWAQQIKARQALLSEQALIAANPACATIFGGWADTFQEHSERFVRVQAKYRQDLSCVTSLNDLSMRESGSRVWNSVASGWNACINSGFLRLQKHIEVDNPLNHLLDAVVGTARDLNYANETGSFQKVFFAPFPPEDLGEAMQLMALLSNTMKVVGKRIVGASAHGHSKFCGEFIPPKKWDLDQLQVVCGMLGKRFERRRLLADTGPTVPPVRAGSVILLSAFNDMGRDPDPYLGQLSRGKTLRLG